MTTDLKKIVLDLRRWEPFMRDESTYSLPAIRYTHAHTTGLQADSQPERATFTKNQFLRDLQQILDAAYSTGWRTDDLDGDMYTWLTTRADWGPRNGPHWAHHVENLESIHTRWAKHCGPDNASQHSCPWCKLNALTSRLRLREDKLYECPLCGYSAEPLSVQRDQRLVCSLTADWITRGQAIDLYGEKGLTRALLRKWVERGKIETCDGLVDNEAVRELVKDLKL